jgi:hypothetical protein
LLSLSAGVALVVGFRTAGWYSVPLMILGALLLVYLAVGLAIVIVYGPTRAVLTPEASSSHRREGGRCSGGLHRGGLIRAPEVTELVLWYDRAKHPELPKWIMNFYVR